MKKQFFRVKQLADQTFLGADKSEGLNHGELQKADHKVEYFRAALSAICKKMPAVQTPNPNENVDKRMKKYPEYQLGQALVDQSKKGFLSEDFDDESHLFQHVIRQCGMVQQDLAREQAEHEIKVETMVCLPVQEILDNEMPTIQKHKRNLSKYILDKDSAKNRLQAVSKNGNQRETLKEEHEEAELKVDQSRDALAAEMFSMLRKENELSQYMLQILKLQRGYHESALKNLEKVIPELEKRIGDSPVKVVFGIALEEHLRVTNRRIAYPIELCICILTELGISEEGLFRVTGGASRTKRLKLSIDSNCFEPPIVDEYRDVHVISSTLKQYLRELPEPLLTKSLYKEWLYCGTGPKTEEQKILAIKEVLKRLPTANRENLTYLIQFLSKLSKHPENKMNSQNIAICIAPNLLWTPEEDMNINMNFCTMINNVVEIFISHADILFPDDLSPYCKLTIGELLGEQEHEFVRPMVHGLAKSRPESDSCHDNEAFCDSSSPKPQTRNKKKAPVPPTSTPPAVISKQDPEFVESKERINLTASYPSGSSTLNRPKLKPDAVPKMKTSVGVNTDEITVGSVRRRSLVNESTENSHKTSDTPKAALVIDDPKAMADHKYVMQPTANIQVSKAKPVQPLQVTIAEKPPLANNVLQKSSNNHSGDSPGKPVAAPRSLFNADTEKATLRIENPLTRSLNSMESMEVEGVQMRRQSRDDGLDRSSKPVIPARPPSLRNMTRSATEATDPSVHKTQCSVYSVPHKQQASIVNIQNRFQAGHDMQIAEKEKFLGHQPNQAERVPAPRLSLENKFNDINSNCDNANVRERTASVGKKPEVPTKPNNIMKSTEKLNFDPQERINGNSKTSHVRTRSDGSLIDIHGKNSDQTLQTPPSPRALNKPTQPPPPPPVSTQRPKSEPDSTDL